MNKNTLLMKYKYDDIIVIKQKKHRIVKSYQVFNKRDKSISQTYFMLDNGKIMEGEKKKLKGVLEL